MWNSPAATAASVTDSAGDVFTKVTSVVASEDTELSVWTAPVTAGVGTAPTITVTPTSTADVGAAVAEYSGLSTTGTGVDVVSTATGSMKAQSRLVLEGAFDVGGGVDVCAGAGVDGVGGDHFTSAVVVVDGGHEPGGPPRTARPVAGCEPGGSVGSDQDPGDGAELRFVKLPVRAGDHVAGSRVAYAGSDGGAAGGGELCDDGPCDSFGSRRPARQSAPGQAPHRGGARVAAAGRSGTVTASPRRWNR